MSAPASWPAVCTVVPTHNRIDLVQVAIRSVLEQTGPDPEVVVVDDGSTPPVGPTLERVFPQVKVLTNQEAVGPAAARNLGAAASQSDYIAFLDDDDRWLPGKIESCIECFRRYPDAGMVMHRMVPDGAAITGTGLCREVVDPVVRMLTTQPPHIGAVVVRRDVHERVRFDEDFNAAEDLDYLLRLAMTTTVIELDRVLAVHGRSHARVSAINLESRIAARAQFRTKHAHLFDDPAAQAFYDLRLGHLYRRGGQRGHALAAYLRSLRRQPSLAVLKGVAATALPRPVVDRLATR